MTKNSGKIWCSKCKETFIDLGIHKCTTKEREAIRPRYDLIPKEWLDELANIFEEGAEKYGEDSWKNKSPAFFKDCLNHAMDHLLRYNNGDISENQLPKVAWNVLAVRWYEMNKNPKEL